jgi:hypothetical protein
VSLPLVTTTLKPLERDPRVLRATRARWVALSAASDDEAARLVHAIDERTAELQRARRIAHNPRRP